MIRFFPAAVFALFLLLFLCNPVLAAGCTVTNLDSHDLFWLEGNASVSINCTCDGDAVISSGSLVVYTPSGQLLHSPDALFSIYDYGSYNVTANCTNGTDPYKSFTAVVLDADIMEPAINEELDFYKGTENQKTVSVAFTKNDESLTVEDAADVSFRVCFDDSNCMPVLDSVSFDNVTEQWTLYIDSLDFESLDLTDDEVYDIKVIASYMGHEVSDIKTNAVVVRPAVSVTFVAPSDDVSIDLTDSSDQEIEFTLSCAGSEVTDGLTDSNVKVYFDNDLLDIKNIKYESDKWNVLVNIPEEDPGVYVLKLKVIYDDVTIQNSYSVRFLIPFSGELADIKGNRIPMKVTFINTVDGVVEKKVMKTDVNGKYFAALEEDYYDVEIDELPGISEILIEDAKIYDKVEDAIKYESFSGCEALEGITFIKSVMAGFDVPFESAYVEIQYDKTKVVNKENIVVFKCTDWHADDRICAGEWEKVELVNENDLSVYNKVGFETKYLSAFMIGETDKLRIRTDLLKPRYYNSETITVSGSVVDGAGKGVSGVEVVYSIDDADIGGRFVTKNDGSFGTEFKCPVVDGDYELFLSVKKAPFNPANKTLLFATKGKDELTLTMPDTVYISRHNSTLVKLSLENTGQRQATNILPVIEGLSSSQFNLIPSKIDSLSAGEEKTITFEVLPVGECQEEECKNYYFIRIRFESDQSSAEDVLTLQIKSDEPAITYKSIKTVQNITTTYTSDIITGNFLSVSGNPTLNTYLILVFIVLAFVIVGAKKRMRFRRVDDFNIKLINKMKSL